MLRLCNDKRLHILGEQNRIDAFRGIPTFTGLHVVDRDSRGTLSDNTH